MYRKEQIREKMSPQTKRYLYNMDPRVFFSLYSESGMLTPGFYDGPHDVDDAPHSATEAKVHKVASMLKLQKDDVRIGDTRGAVIRLRKAK